MKVIQVVPHTRPGGMQEIAYALNEGLPQHGIDSELVSLAELVSDAGSRRHAWTALWQRWQADPPDAVFAHTTLNAVFSLGAARAAGVPRRITVVHSERSTMGRPRTTILAGLAQSRIVTEVVFVGSSAAQTFRPVPGRLMTISTVIQNGVRLPNTGDLRDRSFASAVPLRVVAAARLVPDKNLHTLIRAAAAVGPNIRLSILGDGPERAALTDLAAQLGAPVTFLGHQNRGLLANHFAANDLFAAPSMSEGLPLVLIEAAATGLPVMAADRPFNHELMGPAAIYCDAQDVSAWQHALEGLVGQPDRLLEHSRAGAQRAELFTLERMVSDYAALLRGPTAGRRL